MCAHVQAVIQLRLGYPHAKWRNVYKGLTLLEFLLKRGPETACAWRSRTSWAACRTWRASSMCLGRERT